MEIRILGPLEVVAQTGPVRLPRGRARALLAILALDVGRAVSIDALIDRLWSASPPATARTKLHGLVSSLRKALPRPDDGSSVIETRSPGYALVVSPDRVDAIRFERLIREARSGSPHERIELLREALGLWRGPVLADFRYEPFAQTAINAYEGRRIAATEERLAAELEAGSHAAVVHELEALIAEHPFRERLRELGILAHYRAGDQQRALQLARDTHVVFTEELGVEPGPDLASLELAVLNHDPALQLPRQKDGDAALRSADQIFSESLKPVTVVFVDLGQSPDAGSDPEADLDAYRRRYAAAEEAITRHGGSAQGSVGGVAVAVFGLPVAHEDDPLRAVRAAAELVSDEDGAGPSIGISTGEIVVGEPVAGSSLSGLVPRLAARLQQAAPRGHVLLSDATRRVIGAEAAVEAWPDRIVDEAGRPLTAWKLLRPERRVEVVTGPSSPWVGRADELAMLHDAASAVVASGRPLRVTVLGEPGIGKSRLAARFADALRDSYRVITARCPAYGDGITFFPLREIVQGAAGGADARSIGAILDGSEDVDATVGQLTGAIGSSDYPGRPDDLFPAVRRFVEALATTGPFLMVLDDMHWAQPTFIELVEYLTGSVEGPLLMVCLARPELLDLRPAWAGLDTTLTLAPLDRDQVEELVTRGLVDHRLPYERAEEIVELAGGNPLFVEQVVAALSEHDDLMIPVSLHGLLAARLDHLGPAERDLVRAASVWGVSFRAGDLVEFLPPDVRSTVAAHLGALERKKLFVQADEPDAFEFRHGLIQLVAYRSITKRVRAELHERAVEVLQSSVTRQITEIDETVGFHLEQAAALRTALGIEDDHTEEVAVRAGEHLARAGLRAFRRLDAVAAQRLLNRSLRLLPDDHSERRPATRYLVECHQVMGRHGDAQRLLDTLIENTDGSDEVLDTFLRMERLWATLATGPDPVLLAEIEAQANRAEEVYDQAGYEIGLAQVARVHWHVHLRRGEMAAMEAAAYRGLSSASRSGSGRERLGAEWGVAMALEEGPRPVEECIERCEQVRGEIVNPGITSTLAYLHAMRGEFALARTLVDESLSTLRERVRARRPVAQVKRRAGHIELLAGNDQEAEDLLRESLAMNREQGERAMISQVAGEIGLLLARTDRADDALDLAALSRECAPAEDVTSQAMWRAAQALVSAAQGDAETAERLAREACELVKDDMLTLRATAVATLSDVLASSGHDAESVEVANEAVRLFEEKGNVAGAATVRGRLNARSSRRGGGGDA